MPAGENLQSNSVMRFIQRFRNATLAEVLGVSNRGAALVSAVFVFVLFTICNCAYIAHGLNDDWALSNALSGKWADPQGVTLFINAGLCQLICWLNVHVGGPNWFFFLEFTTACLSYFAITYAAVSRMEAPFACLVIAAFTVLALPGCTWMNNFTFVAFSASCAGLTLLLLSYCGERHSVPLVVTGLAFVLVGICWRGNMFFVAVPVFGIAALLRLASRRRADAEKGSIVHGLLRLWPFAAALLVLGVALLYHGSVWSDEALQEWLQFNNARAAFSDYPRKGYSEIADDLTAIGVSETDYKLLSNWMTEDPEFFTAQRMKDVNGVALARNDTTLGKVAYTFARYTYRVVRDLDLFVFVALAIACIVLCSRGRRRVFALCLVALAFLMGTAFLVIGRLPERVNYPLWLYVFSAIGCLAFTRMNGEEAERENCSESAEGASLARRTKLARSLAAMVAIACLAAPVVSTATVLYKAVPHLEPERARAILAPETFTAESELISFIHDNPDVVVAMNAGSMYDLVYANLMVAPCDEQVISRVVSLGGWASRSPYNNKRNELAGMANPLRGLVENESAVYIAQGERTAALICEYLREHYYPSVKYDQIGKMASHNGDGELLVFKFSRK